MKRYHHPRIPGTHLHRERDLVMEAAQTFIQWPDNPGRNNIAMSGVDFTAHQTSYTLCNWFSIFQRADTRDLGVFP